MTAVAANVLRVPWSRRVAALFYAGSRFRCPLCGGRFRKLRPKGKIEPVVIEKRIVAMGRRPNAKCPRCKSSERERLVYLYLVAETRNFERPTRLLHIAPERALQAFLAGHPRVAYSSCDLESPRATDMMDITKMTYADRSFDIVVCNHVLEHVADDSTAISEIHRVLDSGGVAIPQVPVSLALEHTFEDPTATTPEARKRLFGQDDHVRIYSARDYPSRLRAGGFRVRQIDWTREPSTFGGNGNRYALNPEEPIFVAEKDA